MKIKVYDWIERTEKEIEIEDWKIERVREARKLLQALREKGLAKSEDEAMRVVRERQGKYFDRVLDVVFTEYFNFEINITGKTYETKEKLKEKGFRWNGVSWSKVFKSEEFGQIESFVKSLLDEKLVDIVIADDKHIDGISMRHGIPKSW
jgi:spermidine/putrescine-binding protein